jgi:hypothetical protein
MGRRVVTEIPDPISSGTPTATRPFTGRPRRDGQSTARAPAILKARLLTGHLVVRRHSFSPSHLPAELAMITTWCTGVMRFGSGVKDDEMSGSVQMIKAAVR